MPDFTLGIAGNTQQTVIAGTSANFGLTVASQSAPFTGAVTLSANGLPAGATVSFSPPGSRARRVVGCGHHDSCDARDNGAQHPREARARMGGGGCDLSARAAAQTEARTAVPCLRLRLLQPRGCGARTASESVLPVQTFAIQVQATGTNLAGNVVVHSVSVTLAVE